MMKKCFGMAFAASALLLAGCSNGSEEILNDQPEVLPDGRVEARFSAGGVGGIEEVDGTRGAWNTSL